MSTQPTPDQERPASLAQALSVEPLDGVLIGRVHEGWDVYGIPHGGYLAALGANAVLTATGRPDLFTMTTHYLRKAAVGPMAFEVTEVAGSRRFTTVTAIGRQDGQVVLSVMASVGDRTAVTGPSWTDPAAPTHRIPDDQLTPPAGDPDMEFQAPGVSQRLALRMDATTTGFVQGRIGADAHMRAVCQAPPGEQADQLLSIIACDVTPPVVWNALGAGGWVPTVELTTHVRARPVDGPLTVDVRTNHVSDGFLEEDALVVDAAGTLVLQSRQLARWSNPNG